MDFFTSLWLQLRLTWRLLQDERVAWYYKLIPVAAFAYVISPIDLIPDIPIIGQIDDLAVVMGAMSLFISLIPDGIAEAHRRAIHDNIITVAENEKPKNDTKHDLEQPAPAERANLN
jgi:uncharacterized membrane protein YkvA (DUF1232 family)